MSDYAAYINRYMNLRFASAAERTAKIATPTRGMVSFLDSDGYETYYDGTIWRPGSGQEIAALDATTIATGSISATGPTGFTDPLTLPQYAFPVTVEIDWALSATQTDSADQLEGQLWIGGAVSSLAGSINRQVGSWVNPNGRVIYRRATNAAAVSIQGIMNKVTAAAASSNQNDPRYTYVRLTVRAT